VTPFRSLFPIRYYLNDFEMAVTFDPSSDPSSRVVTGLPIEGIRTGNYARAVAPEMLSDSPYCPFRADIWQLGTMFKESFGVSNLDFTPLIFAHFVSQHLGHISTALIQLIEEMCSQDPDSRPQASVALQRIQDISKGLSFEIMNTSEIPVPPSRLIDPVPPGRD
jgi:serine/threonine protein kinase